MSKPADKPTTPEPKRFPPRFGWGYALAAAISAILLTGVGWATSKRTIELQSIRYQPETNNALFKTIGQKLQKDRSSDYQIVTAINSACWAAKQAERGDRSINDAQNIVKNSAAADPSNGAFDLLRLHIVLIATENAPAFARYEAITHLLNDLPDKPIDFGLGRYRALWAQALAFEYGDEATAQFVAADVLAPRHLALRRSINDRALQLVDALIADDQTDAATNLAIAIVNWSSAAMHSASDVDEVYVWADATAEAQSRLAAIGAVQHHANAATARNAERHARRFARTLHDRIAREPMNAFSSLFAPRKLTTPRKQPFEAALHAGLAAGVMLTGASTACAIAVAAGVLFAIIAIIVKPPTPTWQPPNGAWSIIGVAVLPLVPAAALLVGLRLMPLELNALAEAGWLLSFYYLMVAAVAFPAIALAVNLSRAAMPGVWGRRVWPYFGVVLAAVLYLLLFAPFSVSAAKIGWWETSAFAPIELLRINQLAAYLIVLLLLAPLVGMFAHVVKSARKKRDQPSPAIRVKAFLKHLCILACLWWLVFAAFGMIGVTYAANALNRFQTLELADLQQPVAARMGPNWSTVFFPPIN